MKKTQIKDIFRNIGKQKVSFISVIVIAMLGVAVFLGLDFSAAGMTRNGSDFFNAQQFRDVEVVSTLLLTEEDLDDIRHTEGAADVEAVWQVSAKASSGGDRRDVNVISLTERINLPRLVEGRLPETETECAVENLLAEEMGWTIGDEILLQDASGLTVQYLNGDRFTLVGIADHPDHGNTFVTDTCYVMVTPAAFDREALGGCCMKAEVVIEKGATVDRYSDEYRGAVAVVQERLETLALTGTVRRDADAHDQFQVQIDEKQQELDSAKEELSAARAELDEGWIALAEGEQELTEALAQLEDAQQQLEDAQQQLESTSILLAQSKNELDSAKQELYAGARELESAKAELDSAKAELEKGWNELEDAKAQIRDGFRSVVESALGDSAAQISWAGRQPANVDSSSATAMPFWITTGYCCDLNQSLSGNIYDFVYSDQVTDEMLLRAYVEATGSEEGFNAGTARASLAAAAAVAASTYEGEYNQLQAACRTWDEGHAQYIPGLNEYQAGLARYNEGLAAYEAGRRQYEAGLAAYQSGLEQYNDSLEEYEQGFSAAEEGQEKLEESRKQLEEGETAYQDALSQIADGERQLAKAQDQLEKLDPCRWLITDGSGNPGYVQIGMAEDNLKSLKGTFALLFILVGALVIFATVSKMVDEQRTQVGTTKALGFFNREIFAKYLSFGVSAAVLGTVLGILAAVFGLESIVLGSYNTKYSFDLTKPVLSVPSTVLALLAAAALAVAAVWAACSRLLRTPAIRLMQPKVPEGKKKAGTGKKHTLSLYSRLILLNMRTDFKRVLVTIVSVAGCCALVVIGVTLKTAMTGSMDRHYSEVVAYDWLVSFSPEESETAGAEIEELLRQAGVEYTPLYHAGLTYSVSGIQIAELFCGDIEAIEDFYHLNDWMSGEPLPNTDEGILIQRRVAECYGLDVGSEMEIALGGTKTATVTVAGIFEHYVGRPMAMSPAYFEKVFETSCEPNMFFVRLGDADGAALEEELRSVRGYTGIAGNDTVKSLFEASTGVINTLVVMFIFMAAVMAGVVQLNLTNIYVLQKKRELTIMRVNGFTFQEVLSYMLRETAVTTLLGILLGVLIGSGIAYQICRALEQPFLQFARNISLPAWASGAALTVLFTALVNVIALRPVRNLKLTDVA
ncbi:MAG: ABC transporter permease [Oscillospiraceae bacterium]|nr:ABC transporter permease [Oscillospiraceae bacterium]